MCSASASSSPASAARSTRRSASVAKIGAASAGTVSMIAATAALLILFCRRDAVEPSQAIVEFDGESQLGDGTHCFMRQNVDAAAKSLHEPLEVERMAGEIELHQRMHQCI